MKNCKDKIKINGVLYRRYKDTVYYGGKDGSVFNVKTNKYLTGHITTRGYLRIVLTCNCEKESLPIHRLIAYCWIPVPNEIKDNPTLQIDHINGIKTDNRVENLRWVTAKENSNNRVTLSKRFKAVAAYYKDGRLYKKYESMADAEKEGFCRNVIYKAINKVGRAKYHKGFVWKYI